MPEDDQAFSAIKSGNNWAGKSIITYTYEYESTGEEGKPIKTDTVAVGKADAMASLMSSMMPSGMGGAQTVSLTLRHLGGVSTANDISIYPMDFKMKDNVIIYLDKWNDKGDVILGDKTLTDEQRDEIKYTDNLSLIMDMIDSMIDVVSIALISFTSLALVVSCVMIAIITYVSVVERIKEIGVIRSLGGRKKDVSNLFNAETFIIGASSGLVGIGITYIISLIVNLIVQAAAGFSIMLLPFDSAMLMVGISTLLTVLSGLIPAKKAAHQDPVVALRTE